MPIAANRLLALTLTLVVAVGSLTATPAVLASSGAPPVRQEVTPTETAPPEAPALTESPVPVGSPAPAAASPEPQEPAPPAASGPAPAVSTLPLGAGQVVAIGVFPDLTIASAQNAVLPGSVVDDHAILLGGVGSDIWHGPSDAPDELWMVTDRGPGGRGDNGKDKQSFAVPEYTPLILHVRLGDGGATGVYGVEVLETIPIVGQFGQPVTGLPNLDGRDEQPVDYRAKTKLAYNPSGLDPEGLVHLPNGDFWIAEEYGPSLVHVDPSGQVVKRFLPEGLDLAGTDYPLGVALPALFAKRSDDQGFEGLTASPDGGTLYVAMQGPLSNPNTNTGDHSRQIRILAFDVASEQVTAEYVYRFEQIRSFDPSKKADPEDMKLSALAMCADGELMVLERTPNAARLYLADPRRSTNILGSRWDDPATRPTLEASESMAALNILPLVKTLAVDLTPMEGVPDKLEGLAIVDPSTLVVANDNDFDIGKFDSKGINVGKGERSQLVTISLPQPLP